MAQSPAVSASHARAHASDAVDQIDIPYLDIIARAGYIGRGVVYLLIGVLAVLAAFTGGGQTTGSKGALRSLAEQSWGSAALMAIAIGVFAFAIWRFVQGAVDADDRGKDAKALIIRAARIASGLAYTLLGAYAIDLALRGIGVGTNVAGGGGGGGSGAASGSAGGGGGSQALTAWLMSKPAGIWLVGALGAIVVAVGVVQLVIAVKKRYEKHLAADRRVLEKISPICRAGLIARAVTFWIIGGFIIYAAVRANPDQARGLGGALDALRSQPFGQWLLGAVALGLVAFAVYCFIEARYRMIPRTAKQAA